MHTDQRHLLPVGALYDGKRLSAEVVADVPILYRWWFPEQSEVMLRIEAFLSDHPADGEMQYARQHLKKKAIDGITYYALYLGKSQNGRTRFGNHIRGPQKDSTLRRTIAALLGTADEAAISSALMPCCLEWTELADDPELLDCVELMAISMGYYPLNIDGNQHISAGWKEHLSNRRS